MGRTVPSGLGTGNMGKAQTTVWSGTSKPAVSRPRTMRPMIGEGRVSLNMAGAPNGLGSDTPCVVRFFNQPPSGSRMVIGGTGPTAAGEGTASGGIRCFLGSN